MTRTREGFGAAGRGEARTRAWAGGIILGGARTDVVRWGEGAGLVALWVVAKALQLVAPATACGVLNKQCEVAVRSAVVALQCEGGSGSRSGARQCERGIALRICFNTQKMRDGPTVRTGTRPQ